MKKIVMAEFSDVRFDARVLKEAYSLSKHGYDVKLFLYNAAENKNTIYSKNNVEFNIFSFPSRHSNVNKFSKIKRNFKAIYIIFIINMKILMTKADIYHAHNLFFLFSSVISSKIRNAKVVYDAHELHSEAHNNKTIKGMVQNKFNYIYETLLIPHCEIFIQASEERAEYIMNKYKIEKPIVINNYVPYIESINNNILRDKYNILDDEIILFYSGGIYLSGARRLDKVIEALTLVHKVKFFILGFMNESISQKMNEVININNVQDKVVFLPPCPQDELMKYVASADIGIIPLYGDEINNRLSALNKVSEYMMGGLSLVTSDYPVLEKIIYENPVGQIGHTFDVTSITSIASAINRTKTEMVSKDFKRNALRLAKDHYNWENEECKLIHSYNTKL